MQKKTRRSRTRAILTKAPPLGPAALERRARDFLRLSREVREAASALGTGTRTPGHPAAGYFADIHPRLEGIFQCASRVKRSLGARRPAFGPLGLDYILEVGRSLLHQVEISRLATALDSGRRRSRASSFGLQAFLDEAAREGPFAGLSPVTVQVPAALSGRRLRGDRACLKRLLLYLLGRAVADGVRRPVVLKASCNGRGVLLEVGFRVGSDGEAAAPDAGYAAARRLAFLLRAEVTVGRRGRSRTLGLAIPAAGT